MSSRAPTVSLRHVALAVTTITVAFAAGESAVSDGRAGDAGVAPANDATRAVRAVRYHRSADVPHVLYGVDAETPGPVHHPYADHSMRQSWAFARERGVGAPGVTQGVQASAQGYVVQVGASASVVEGVSWRLRKSLLA